MKQHSSGSRDTYIEHLRVQYQQGALRATLLDGPVPASLRAALLPHLFPAETVYS